MKIMKETKGWDCNKTGCPGMAHACTRINYAAAMWRYEKDGEVSLQVQESFFQQCSRYERELGDLKAELLEAYRKASRDK